MPIGTHPPPHHGGRYLTMVTLYSRDWHGTVGAYAGKSGNYVPRDQSLSESHARRAWKKSRYQRQDLLLRPSYMSLTI
jgi:hypothetical protein